jgi:hypothetical protein
MQFLRCSFFLCEAPAGVDEAPVDCIYYPVSSPPLGAPFALCCLIRCSSMLEKIVEPL